MDSVLSNIPALLFLIGGILAVVSLATKEKLVPLAAGLLLACIAGLAVTLG